MINVDVLSVPLQAEMKFHDLSTLWKEGGVSSQDTQCQPRGAVSKPVIPPISFEVSSSFDTTFVDALWFLFYLNIKR